MILCWYVSWILEISVIILQENWFFFSSMLHIFNQQIIQLRSLNPVQYSNHIIESIKSSSMSIHWTCIYTSIGFVWPLDLWVLISPHFFYFLWFYFWFSSWLLIPFIEWSLHFHVRSDQIKSFFFFFSSFTSFPLYKDRVVEPFHSQDIPSIFRHFNSKYNL